MRILKKVMLGLLLLFGLGFTFTILLPLAPAASLKISGSDWKLHSEFHEISETAWKKQGAKLVFNNQSTEKQKVTLFTDLLPSEHKKEGYVMTSVKIPCNFKELPDDCIFGFQIGEAGAIEAEQLVLGLNGKGEFIALNGELESLTEEEFKQQNRLEKPCSDFIEIGFHYYRNPHGWVTYLKAESEIETKGIRINKTPARKLSSCKKELSLIVYNPSQEGNIWFQDWKIYNDWTPND